MRNDLKFIKFSQNDVLDLMVYGTLGVAKIDRFFYKTAHTSDVF